MISAMTDLFLYKSFLKAIRHSWIVNCEKQHKESVFYVLGRLFSLLDSAPGDHKAVSITTLSKVLMTSIYSESGRS